MTLGRCPLSIFCSRGTPPYHKPKSATPQAALKSASELKEAGAALKKRLAGLEEDLAAGTARASELETQVLSFPGFENHHTNWSHC